MQCSKVGIVGCGYVGKAMYRAFLEGYNNVPGTVVWYDPYVPSHVLWGVQTASALPEVINTCDLVIISVPTPAQEGGTCDLRALHDVFAWLSDAPLIMIKSTVTPGTTDALSAQYPKKRIVFSPEYIGESNYFTGKHDFTNDPRRLDFVTIGGSRENVSTAIDLLLPVFGPNKKYNHTDALTAEMAKYMENAYLALKVTFCYEFDQICKAHGADYHAVRECWLLDPRIESSHTGVFKDNIIPWAGKCLPKDLSAIIQSSRVHGYTPDLLREVVASNTRIGEARIIENDKL